MGSTTRPRRFFWLAGVSALLLVAAPASFSPAFRGVLFSVVRAPLDFSGQAAQWLQDFFNFRRNGEENRAFRQMVSQEKTSLIQSRELRLENERLTRLLELRPSAARIPDRLMYARVIARSSLAWNRTLWIDKGFEDGMRENLPVFTGEAVIGKILEVRPAASKILLITDPNCKIGVMIQRTRQQGILYGTLSGGCRMKYISIDADVKPGDRVETAGLGIFFPKGIAAGTVHKVWKEPGQIYQTAQVRPLADFGKLEEVAVIDTR